ncbi:MAG: STELLO glycosyltransferase family protein [Desulfobacterales bacterium]|jgi:hypothetical protein
MSPLTNPVVITSIFPPGEAVRRFAALTGWRLVVVGDKRSPAGWTHPGVEFLSVSRQRRLAFKTAGALPWNHYARKMLGYLWAAKEGADLIGESDDDNLPAPGWAFPDFEGRFQEVPADRGFINIYSLFTDQAIWPRGLPLSCIRSPEAVVAAEELATVRCRIGVWQALVDGDPDVDAIYRLTANTPCRFARRPPVVLGTGTLSPFNSQNTAFSRKMLPLMYLPAYVNFRVTDILRSYVAQPIMWSAGYRLGFSEPSVLQARNAHDLMADFRSELPIYLEAEEMMACILEAVRDGDSLSDNLYGVYRGLGKIHAVKDDELRLVDAWLEDVDGLSRG